MHSPFDKIDETPEEPFPSILSFANYIPERKKKYPVGMQQGSLVRPEDEEDDQEFSLSEKEIQDTVAEAFSTFNMKKPMPKTTPLDLNMLEGSDGTVGKGIAGENTVGGWIAGLEYGYKSTFGRIPSLTSNELTKSIVDKIRGKTQDEIDEEARKNEEYMANLRKKAEKSFIPQARLDKEVEEAEQDKQDYEKSIKKSFKFDAPPDKGTTDDVSVASVNTENTDDTDDNEGESGQVSTASSGGQIKGYQEGAMVEEQADTTMDTAGLGPMGLVDDMDGDQVTGVADDLNMETEEGAYVLNADAVELIGLKDLNKLVKDAIEIAVESDIPLPKAVDPTKKVPIKISNGEFVIPAILVPIIGLENLEKMNKRGLMYREKNREEGQASPPEAEQQNIPVEPSEVPSRGVPGEINI